MKGFRAVGGPEVGASKGQQFLKGDIKPGHIVLHVLFKEPGCKPVKTGLHRRMGGKEIAGPGGGERLLEADIMLLHEIAGSFKNDKGGMPLVEVADLWGDLQVTEETIAADSQNDFLLQTHP